MNNIGPPKTATLTRMTRNGNEHAWIYIETYPLDKSAISLRFHGRFNPWLDIKEFHLFPTYPSKLIPFYEKLLKSLTDRGFQYVDCISVNRN